MAKDKDILLIAYTLPPAPGVGARRWSKLCKYLVRQDYNIQIITAAFDKKHGGSPWEQDITHPRIKIHRVKGGLNPNWLFNPKSPRVFRIKERYLYKFHRKFHHWIDYAEGWGPALLSQANIILKEGNIKTVIVTGPPNSVNYFAALLKLENPKIKLIQDIRDPWNEDPYDYGYPNALPSIAYKNKALFCQETAFRFCDHIVSVSQSLTDIFIKNWNVADKITTISNGYDPEDKILSKPNKSSKMKFIYAGFASGMGRMTALDLFRQAITELTKTDSFWTEKCDFVFVGDGKLKFKEKNFRTLPYLPSAELAQEVATSHIGFTINSPEYHFLFGSKLYDYMLQGISTFLISSPGEMCETIEKKHLGYYAPYDLQKIKVVLEKMKLDFQAGKLAVPSDSTVAEYSFDSLAHKYWDLIQREI